MLLKLPFQSSRQETFRYLGYQENMTQDWPQVERLFEKTKSKIQAICAVQGGVKTWAEPPLSLQGNDLPHLFRYSKRISILAVTLGGALDQWIIQAMQEGNFAQAAMADALGSAAAEEAMETLNRLVSADARLQGFRTTPRFSPGYGDAPLEMQAEVLNALGENRPQVQVLAGGLLTPRKSVTALLGWEPLKGPAAQLGESCSHHCVFCPLEECKYRKA